MKLQLPSSSLKSATAYLKLHYTTSIQLVLNKLLSSAEMDNSTEVQIKIHPKLALFRIVSRFSSSSSFFLYSWGGKCHSAFCSLLLHFQFVSSPAAVPAGFPARRSANFTVAALVVSVVRWF